MFTISTAQAQVLATNTRAEYVRVEVKDAGGTWRDLDSYPGYAAVKSVSWGADQDAPHATADVIVSRDVGRLSLAPLMETSPVNTGWTVGGTWSPLISPGREFRISTATVSAGRAPVSGDWALRFHGRIDEDDSAAQDMKFGGRDLGGLLSDTWIETERVYGLAEVSGTAVAVRVWEPQAVYAVNTYVVPSDGRRAASPYFYKVTTGGTSHTAEPATWPASGPVTEGGGDAQFEHQGSITTAGQPVEEVMQNILDDNLGAGVVTLYTPSSPGWEISAFIQQRQGLLEALRTLARQIGWDCRYKWDSGTSAFRLTLFEPDRAKSSVDRTFTAAQYKKIAGLKRSIMDVRNAVRVVYSDVTDTVSGVPKRKVYETTNAASITKYGRRFMELAEATLIDTPTEAAKYGAACLADVKEPLLDQDIQLGYGFPWAELGDRYTFGDNARHYTMSQTLACFSYRHEASKGVLRTTLRCSGAPCLGVKLWLKQDGRARADGIHRFTNYSGDGGITISSTPIVGGTHLTFSVEDRNRQVAGHPEFVEVHLAPTSNFTVSDSTLKGITASENLEITNLTPGATYYGKIVSVQMNASRVVRGLPSTEISLVAGRGSAGHLSSDVGWGRLPLNGGFETYTNVAPYAPDHWSVGAGTWGDQLNLMEDGNNVTGKRWVKMDCAANEWVELTSAYFEITEGELYQVTYWYKVASVAGGSTVRLMWDNSNYAQATSSEVQLASYGTAGAWLKATHIVKAPSGYRYARLTFERPAMEGGTIVYQIDDVRVEPYDCAAIYKSNSGQSISASTSTVIDFEDKVYDPTIFTYGGNITVVTTGAAWKAYARTAGRYLVTCQASLDWDGYASAAILELNVLVNGARDVLLCRTDYVRNQTVEVITGSAELLLVAGDYVQFYLYHTADDTKSMWNDEDLNRCSFRRIGDYGDGT